MSDHDHTQVDTQHGYLKIQHYKLQDIPDNSTILLIGRRGNGKSTVVKSLIERFKDLPAAVIISPTDRVNDFYSSFFPSSFIYNDYKTSILEKIFARQKTLLKKDPNNPNARLLLIMDDCLSCKGEWLNDPLIRELIFNGRHYKITFILTMQAALGITPEYRNNFIYVFITAEDHMSELRKLFLHYCSVFPDFNSFKDVFSQLTIDWGCMLVVNKNANSKFTEKIFRYRSDISDAKIRFGSTQFIKYNDKNLDKNWKEKIKEFDIVEYCVNKKKRKEQVKIRC